MTLLLSETEDKQHFDKNKLAYFVLLTACIIFAKFNY